MKKKLLVVLISLVFLITTLPAVITIPFRIDSSNNEVESSFWFYGNKITIIRDNYGVPHIYAGTKEGLAYGCGYAMAQDRLWQADLYRKQGYGNLAEFRSWANRHRDEDIKNQTAAMNFYEGRGESYGLDIHINNNFKNFEGWIGYTLAKTVKNVPTPTTISTIARTLPASVDGFISPYPTVETVTTVK